MDETTRLLGSGVDCLKNSLDNELEKNPANALRLVADCFNADRMISKTQKTILAAAGRKALKALQQEEQTNG